MNEKIESDLTKELKPGWDIAYVAEEIYSKVVSNTINFITENGKKLNPKIDSRHFQLLAKLSYDAAIEWKKFQLENKVPALIVAGKVEDQ